LLILRRLPAFTGSRHQTPQELSTLAIWARGGIVKYDVGRDPPDKRTQPRIHTLMAQASVVVKTACGYPASAGVVCASVESGRDDARERARASIRMPRSAGCGHGQGSSSLSMLSGTVSGCIYEPLLLPELGSDIGEVEEEVEEAEAGVDVDVGAKEMIVMVVGEEEARGEEDT